MRKIDTIIVHCADTPASMDIGAEEIKRWHTDPKPRGNGWSDIGYHHVIRRDGTIESGRAHEVIGAHAAGHNKTSLGVCLVGGKGGFNFTHRQMDVLYRLLISLTTSYPDAQVIGHRDVSSKSCPSFDVKAWWGL